MYKKIVLWLFFTVVAGLLPIGFIWLACELTNTAFTDTMISSEIFFFNLILSADGVKELFSSMLIKKKKNKDSSDNKNNGVKITFLCIEVFVLIIIAVIYGAILINDYSKGLDLQLDVVYASMKKLTVACIAISCCIQVIGGAEGNE